MKIEIIKDDKSAVFDFNSMCDIMKRLRIEVFEI